MSSVNEEVLKIRNVNSIKSNQFIERKINTKEHIIFYKGWPQYETTSSFVDTIIYYNKKKVYKRKL